MSMRTGQTGVSLIEVLVSLLIMGIGLLGAAALQLNALKFTDSSALTSQASFIAYDMMDRIRANPDGNYVLANLDAAPTGNMSDTRAQDLADFAANAKAIGGVSAGSSIAVNNRVVTITVQWSDARATNTANVSNVQSSGDGLQTFTLTSRVAIDKGIK
ncbi:pilus assembly protein PilV [Pseudomonas rhizosphaerae]|jgi:type IV pilus assembly protein PilV|uniref:Pilus assembly protein PilV n=1 Tax=Pseudomonas rhizosphaerae TaxID=216142 RepID=A0A089YV80_9PSED|nr:type IV pilus modification protein PilV [Pseudomonas rhizosphaerae]AIS19514.1 pilus assembly protein PilV [Pseudomonas rhizosphaerae]